MVCGNCYAELTEDKEVCFGKQYNPSLPICTQFCPDAFMCKRQTHGRLVRVQELTEEGRRAALDLLTTPKRTNKPKSKHPFPQRNTVIRVCWELCLAGITHYALERECRRMSADYKYVLRVFRREKKDHHEWSFNETATDIKIHWRSGK